MKLSRDEHLRAEGAINALDLAGPRIKELETKNSKLRAALERALIFAKEEQIVRENSFLPEPTRQEEVILEEVANVVDGITAALKE